MTCHLVEIERHIDLDLDLVYFRAQRYRARKSVPYKDGEMQDWDWLYVISVRQISNSERLRYFQVTFSDTYMSIMQT